MAVVKAKFTKGRNIAKNLIGYIQGRPGKDGERMERLLFGADGQMTREQALSLIDEAGKRVRFFHLILSPDPVLEDSRKDLSLSEITKHIMQLLEDKLQQAVVWVAALHDDHRPHRHVHIVAGLKGRLNVQDLALLREAATEVALLQRQQLDLNQTRDWRRGWGVRSPAPRTPDAGTLAANRPTTGRPTTGKSTAPVKPSQQQGASGIPSPNSFSACCCPYCLALQPSHANHHIHRCQSCGKRLHQESKLKYIGTERKESGWEL